MRFNPKAKIGSGRVRDAGGGGGGGGLGGGGMRLPIPGGMKAGGGLGGIVLVVLFLVITQCTGGSLPGLGGGSNNAAPGGDQGAGSDRYEECQTGEDANENSDCARKAVVLSLEKYWTSQFDNGFEPAPVRTFSGSVSTGCGNATSQVGPFYCPTDQTIFLDSAFFERVLEGQLKGKGGDFVEPYVLGHEYGHHIQNLTGQMGNVKTQQGPDSDAVKLELQADCYAGLWTAAAESTTDTEGVAIFEDIDDGDIQEAVDAAYTVGDDHIQEVTQGRVDADSWTHGSSDQRMEWFRRGYEGGSYADCDIWKQ